MTLFFVDDGSGLDVVRSLDEYTIPEEVAQHIDFIADLGSRFPKISKFAATAFRSERHAEQHADQVYHSSSVADSETDNSPIISWRSPRDQQFTARIVLRCLNGNFTTDASQPCAEYGDSVASVEIFSEVCDSSLIVVLFMRVISRY